MKKISLWIILLAIVTLMSSCGLAQSVVGTASRTLQSVGRTVF